MKGFNSNKVYKIVSLLVCYLLAFNVNASMSNSNTVGTMKGSASVVSGSALYSLPIELPSGIHGLSPSLAIQYKQGAGNGHLGLGFHLTGQSSITRCTETLKVDGVVGAISFSFDDVYCLDGERLIPVSGQNGRGGSEYRVGNKLTTKVVANGTNSSSPQSWSVYSSDGYIYDYGTNVNSVETANEHNLIWHLSTQKDRFDNELNYSYAVDSGFHYLQSVAYNDVNVNFIYKGRSDELTSYRFGEERKLTQLLEKIEIITTGGLLRTVKFAYGDVFLKGFVSYSRLNEVKTCDAQNNCMRPHKFEWKDNPAASGSPRNINLFSLDTLEGYVVGDLNNDGAADVCYFTDGLYCALNNGNAEFGNASKWTSGFDGSDWEEPESHSSLALFDINNDTFLDVCAFNENGFFCAENDHNGKFTDAHYWTQEFTVKDAIRLIDLDQDQLVDLCKIDIDEIKCVFNTGSGFDNITAFSNIGFPLEKKTTLLVPSGKQSSSNIPSMRVVESSWGKLPLPRFLDVNLDGYLDICGFKLDGNFYCAVGNKPAEGTRAKVVWKSLEMWAQSFPFGIKTIVSTEQPEFEMINNGNIVDDEEVINRLLRTFRVHDINNDGLVDICYRDGNSFQCKINSGTKFLSAEEWFSLASDDWTITDTVGVIESSIQLEDRNGDGLVDFCYIKADELFCVYNNGHEFVNDTKVINLRVDIEKIEEKSKFYSNKVRKWFGLKTDVNALFTRSAYGPFKQVSDLNGDAMYDDCYRSFEGLSCLLYEHKPLALLLSITSGLGYQTSFDYGFMSDPNIFTPSENVDLPLYSATPNLNVVTAINHDNGIGGQDITQYQYEGYLAHQKFGSLGFEKIVKTAKSTNTKTTINYSHDNDFNTFVSSSSVEVNNKAINLINFEYDNINTGFSEQSINQLKSKQSKSYDLDGSLITSQITEYSSYDEYLYPRSVVKTTTDSLGNTFSERTVTLFEHNKTTWLLGKPKQISVTKESPSNVETRVTEFGYFSSGALEYQIIEPGHELELTTSYSYDSHGLRRTEHETGKEVNRSSTTDYDYAGRVNKHTNGLGHSATTLYDPLCGLPSTVTDANGLTTAISYDGFCRKKGETYPDGTTSSYYFSWSDGADAGVNRDGLVLGDRSVYQLTSQSSLGSWKTVYFDALGREVRSKQLGFNNKVVIKDIAYDEQGRVAGETTPYFEGLFSGDASYWRLTQYDLLSRVATISQPTEDGYYIDTQVSYDGTTVSTQGQDGHLKEETKDGLGRVVNVVENSQSTIMYSYDAFGNLVNTDVNGQITTMTYDLLGNKKSMVDPAMGTWSYGYDAKGRVLWQLDAKKQQTDYTYDVLGRKKTEKATGVNNSWVYDSLFLGALTSESTLFSNKSYEYDLLGRVLSTTVRISDQSYVTSYDYNEDGRLSRVTYPSGLNLEKDYDLNGLLKRASLPNSDIWDKDYLKIEDALKETAASILELEIQASNYEKSAIYYLEQSELLRENALVLLKQHDDLASEAKQLQESAERLYESSSQNAELANNYRNQAQYYWELFADRVFKYDKTENGVAYYKFDECVKSNSKGCKNREYFTAAVPAWMVENSYCIVWKFSNFEYCYTGPQNSINLSDIYNSWADHYQAIADDQNEQSELDMAESNAYQMQAEEASQRANELLEKAKEYADLARNQTDLLSANMDELDSLVATQEELTTMLDERLSDDSLTPLWVATNRDSFGQITSELFGNGFVSQREMDRARGTVKRITTKFGDTLFRDINYEYDIRNNVLHKFSNVRLQKESYLYDDFDRLEYWSFEDTSSIKQKIRDYEYDIYGNLTFKTGVGALEVANSGRIISDSTGLYSYDDNGNMLSGRGRTFEWNSFNKVAKLSDGEQQVKFQYGASQERIKRTIGNKTTYYVSPDYEVDVETDEQGKNVTTMRHRIFAGGQVVAEHIKTKVDDVKQVDKTAYFHRDALNSADLITDNMSKVQLERTYTPFGEVLNVAKVQPVPAFVHENLRGYTGHENVGVGTLINMNARLYDPVIGRFISADSMIPAPYNSQSYNRYAYVYNNPLKYTDPTGHFAWIPFVIGAAIFTAAMTYENPTIQMIGMVVGTFLMSGGGAAFASAEAAAISGAQVGFTTSFITSGGDLGAGLKGAILGGVSAATAWGIGHGFGKNWDIGGKALAHGATQGGFSELRGGSFREGFIGGSIGKLGGTVVHDNIPENMQLIGMTAVAGIAGLATGGNSDTYLRAAVSAITVYLYNEMGAFARSYEGEAKMTEGLQSTEEGNAYAKTPAFKSEATGYFANRADDITSLCVAANVLACASVTSLVSVTLSGVSVYYDYQAHGNVNGPGAGGVIMDGVLYEVGDKITSLGAGRGVHIAIDLYSQFVDYLFDTEAEIYRNQ